MALISSSRFRFKPGLLVWLVAGLLVLGVAGFFLFGQKKNEEPYRTAQVSRGDLTRSVSASGTLQALITVQVGSQISGQVSKVYVDFNSPVTKGQLLATIDPSTYQSRIVQGQSDVNAQAAAVNQQRAALALAQANLKTQEAAYARVKTLYDKGYEAKAALDTAAASLAAAQASVKTAQAGITAQSARVTQSQAALASNQIDMSRTRIVSPIDGVVVDRQVDAGQTVAASLSAPTMFVIAQDLSRLQVKINVDEADIGQIKEGQSVRFTVDAFPDDHFTGVVTQVRKQPVSQQNVVAYIVIAEAANPDRKLLPGMTANADIVIEELKGVLKVPSAALRFTPAGAQAPAQQRGGGFGGPGGGGGQGGGGQGSGSSRMLDDLGLDAPTKAKAQAILDEARAKAMSAGGADRRTAFREAMNSAFDKIKPLLKPDQQAKLEALRARTASGGKRGTIWVLRDGKPVAIQVRVGASDGTSTQITTRELKEDDEVIIGGGPRPKAKTTGSPLAPVQQRGPGGGGGRRIG